MTDTHTHTRVHTHTHTQTYEGSARRRAFTCTTHNIHKRQPSVHPARYEPAIPASERPQDCALGYGYTGARNDTTQQSGQTPDKEVEIKNITVYVSGYAEADKTGILSPPTVWRQQSDFVWSRQSGQIPAAGRIRF